MEFLKGQSHLCVCMCVGNKLKAMDLIFLRTLWNNHSP